MRIMASLERLVSCEWAHSFLDVQIFSCSEFMIEVYKWKGVNF